MGRQGASKSEASYSIIPQILIESFLADYPWGDLPEGASVCDIGGSIGQFLALLHKEFPHLKLKLQDLPIILKQAEDTYWPKEAPEALEKQCIEFKAMDFTKEPPIPGCDVYYVSLQYLFDYMHPRLSVPDEHDPVCVVRTACGNIDSLPLATTGATSRAWGF